MAYQQARSYTVKYENGGIEVLKDNRGKKKNIYQVIKEENETYGYHVFCQFCLSALCV